MSNRAASSKKKCVIKVVIRVVLALDLSTPTAGFFLSLGTDERVCTFQDRYFFLRVYLFEEKKIPFIRNYAFQLWIHCPSEIFTASYSNNTLLICNLLVIVPDMHV